MLVPPDPSPRPADEISGASPPAAADGTTVDGAEVYASDGTISYTTVSLRQATLFGLASGWIDDDVDVVPRDEVLGGRDADENRTLNMQMMDTSKQVATQVALERLGHPVDVSITGETVVEVIPDMPADGVLEPGDTITVQSPESGAERDVELALAADPDDPKRAIMGVRPSPSGVDFDFPFDVEIDTGDVGGPSAGLAFTLAIIDDLTPGDLTGGAKVAVTGTIAGDGSVGPVGGGAFGSTPGGARPPDPPLVAGGRPRRHFSPARKGYDPAEVRGYLHELSDLVARLQRAEAHQLERAERAEARAELA